MTIPIFAHVAAASALFPVISGIMNWKQQSRPVRVFILFCCISLLIIVIEFVLGRMGIPNQTLSNYYLYLEFCCFLFLYHQWTAKQWLKDTIQYSGMTYFLIWLINKYFFEDPLRFGDYIATISSGILITLSIIILYEIVGRSTTPLAQQALFWIASGILLYSSGTIMVITFSNTILEMGINYFDALWHINWGFVIVANLMYARSFPCKIF